MGPNGIHPFRYYAPCLRIDFNRPLLCRAMSVLSMDISQDSYHLCPTLLFPFCKEELPKLPNYNTLVGAVTKDVTYHHQLCSQRQLCLLRPSRPVLLREQTAVPPSSYWEGLLPQTAFCCSFVRPMLGRHHTPHSLLHQLAVERGE